VTAELACGQDLGEGLRRMVESMELSGRAAPSVHPTLGGVRVTLRGGAAESEKLQELPELAQAVYEMIGGRAAADKRDRGDGGDRPVDGAAAPERPG